MLIRFIDQHHELVGDGVDWNDMPAVRRVRLILRESFDTDLALVVELVDDLARNLGNDITRV